MALNLFEVGMSDCNGEDFAYTVAAQDGTEAAVLAVQACLDEVFDGSGEDMRDDTDDPIRVTVLGDADALARPGVIAPKDRLRLSLAEIADLVAARGAAAAPAP